MHQKLVEIKLLTDVRQIEKMTALKPGKMRMYSDQVKKLMVNIHMIIMDKIRWMYMSAQLEVIKKSWEPKTKVSKEMESVMQNWLQTKRRRTLTDKKIASYNLDRFYKPSESDKLKLKSLQRFESFDWWVVKRTVKTGHYFGNTSLIFCKKQKTFIRQYTAIVTLPTIAVVISHDDYQKIFWKHNNRMEENNLSLIQQTQLFSSLSLCKMQKLKKLTEEQVYTRNQFVYK